MNVANAFERTRTIQQECSDPASSAWVVANAGSGKTHVLTQRVIRLLLSGADPSAILCLTFTKVAAAEMARRVFGRLGEWAVSPDTELRTAIREIEGRDPTPDEMRRARRLFARALETPGGLKIQTIHALCERLLHQFPFEANVPGQFGILDDNSARSLIADARADVMNEAAAKPDARLGRAMRRLAEGATDAQIGAALDALIDARDSLRQWVRLSAGEPDGGDIGDALADLRARLGLASDESVESICGEICDSAEWGREACDDLIAALSACGNSADRTSALALAAVSGASEERSEADGRLAFFLTGDGIARRCRSAAHRLSKALRGMRSGVAERFSSEAERVLQLAARLDLARAYEATEALLVVGDAILQAYHAAKRRSGMLDFNDLIVKTRDLLSRADAADWVLYKLDRRIDHILVDEAQDTSPDQWAVVQALAEDFFSGDGAARALRTIFAVGDDKQSIFGFQGAAPHMLAEMERFFARRVKSAEAGFVTRPLFLSFRSTTEILDAVDAVFKDLPRGTITEAESYELHAARRHAEPGHVVVMPRIARPKYDEPEDWTTAFDAPSSAETELARRIAEEIDELRDSALPSGKLVREGEILILVRKRDAFAAAMHRALRARAIATAGSDRIPVATHIAVLDLLALADVMLLPEDDLQLAALLKSPLLGIGEEELMRLATARGHTSLWAALQASDDLLLQNAAKRLLGWRGMADQVTPFRFFASVLGPDNGRRAFCARLGGEADDILDTFLNQALAFESLMPPTLQGFVRFIRANESDIKRETEDAAKGVRIMTVHGAKGLEADVVFLVDTGGYIVVPNQRDKLVRIGKGRDDPAFLWRRAAIETPAIQQAADAVADAETEREYLRLLYVAMTRARDVLYVAGIKGERTPEGSWHSLVRNALVPEQALDGDSRELSAAYRWPEPGRPAAKAPAAALATQDADAAPPEWLFSAAPPAPAAPEPLRPSQALAEPDPGRDGIASLSAGGALLHGRLVHRLVQILPSLLPDRRESAARRLFQSEGVTDPEITEAAWAEAASALADPAVSDFCGPKSRAEVAIAGRIATARGEFVVSGRIDRLVRESNGWHVVDFKTGGAVPGSPEKADQSAIRQLALYRWLLMEMEPGAEVRATLVFTRGPKAMPIPVEFMERELAQLGARDMAFP